MVLRKEGENELERFRVIKSKATPLGMANIDTDQIIPKQFLKLVQKTGFGKYLFYDWRFNKDGNLNSKFILNNPKYVGRRILLTRDNFGSGSSREHAVWALQDYGFKAIIARSFADIFYSNCFKNGLLPISLNQKEIEYLFIHPDEEVEVNLSKQQVIIDSKIIVFEINESRKTALVEGLDDIGITLRFELQIAEYESKNNLYTLL